ncbi:MAG TPA: hypothetical protein VET65_02500 [Candidatus Limnocylindrales bacterium]|nr:hypothetical protein [Candidatus Limnocylindrales bacterium]
MAGQSGTSTLQRIALVSVGAYGLAFVVILIGFAAGSQRTILGAGFLIGGLAVLANLVFRLLWMSSTPKPAPARRKPAPAVPATTIPGIVTRSVAALVMLWVGVSFLIRGH